MNQDVKEKFASYPGHVRPKLQFLRQLILDVASTAEGVGPLEETLKWGEPAYLTAESGSGTTIRIDWKPKNPGQYAMYVNCRTKLVDTFKSLFPDELSYEGNRAIVFDVDGIVPEKELRLCIAMALKYHKEER